MPPGLAFDLRRDSSDSESFRVELESCCANFWLVDDAVFDNGHNSSLTYSRISIVSGVVHNASGFAFATAMTGTVELCQAILDNKIDKVRQLIATSSDPKELVNGVCVVQSCYGEDFTPLLLAAEHGYAGAQIMSILLDAGAVDAFGEDRTKGFPARKYDRYSLFNVVIDNGDVKLAVHLAKAAVVSQESAIEYVDYLLGLTAHTSWFLERPACDNWDPIGALQMAAIELLALHSLVDERRDNTRPGQVNGWIAAALERQHCFILQFMMSKCGRSGWEFLWERDQLETDGR